MSEVKTDKISSVSTNGDITLDPDGTGKVVVPAAIEATTSTHANASVFKSTGNTQIMLQDTDATANDQFWGLQVSGGDFNILTCNDDRASGFLTPLTIDSSGNIGMGITPTQPLHIDSGSSTTRIRLENDGTASAGGNGLNLSIDNSLNATLTNAKAGILSFGTSNAERMRLSSSGDLILGTTSTIGPAQFNVDGGSQAAIGIRAGNGTSGYFNQVVFANNGNTALIGSIQRVNNASVQYNTTSDARLKENIADMTGAITRVKQLTPKRYSWVEEDLDAADQDGFLAHEAQTVVPGAVSGTQDEVDGDGNPVYMQMDYSKLVPVLTAALKESITKIETLETEMTALKARVTALEDA